MPIGKEINSLEVFHEPRRVDNGNTSVQSGNLVETTFSDQLG